MKQLFDIDLVEELGLTELPEEQQAEMIEQMGTALMQTIIARILPVLNEEDQKAFETLLETAKDMVTIQEFLSARITNFHDIVNEEVSTFKKEALDFYKRL